MSQPVHPVGRASCCPGRRGFLDITDRPLLSTRTLECLSVVRTPKSDWRHRSPLRGLPPLLAAAILLVVLALAGCGGGTDEGAEASPEEFANEISSTCEPYTAELSSLVSPEEERGGELGFRRYGQVFREGAEITEELLAELERLEPPESATVEWGRYLDALDAANEYRAELGAELGAAFSTKRGLKGLSPEAEMGRKIDEANAEYDEAVEGLESAGVSSDCFSEVTGE